MNRRGFIGTLITGVAAIALLPEKIFAQKEINTINQRIAEGDIARLLRGRVAVDEYRGKDWKVKDKKEAVARDERNHATMKMNEALKNEGFSGASDFSDFNNIMNLTEYKRCTPIEGECDGCSGLEIPECVKVYGNNGACYNTRPKIATDIIYQIVLKSKRENNFKTKNGKATLVCPEGHGFYLDESKRLNPDFDYTWRIE